MATPKQELQQLVLNSDNSTWTVQGTSATLGPVRLVDDRLGSGDIIAYIFNEQLDSYSAQAAFDKFDAIVAAWDAAAADRLNALIQQAIEELKALL